MSARSVPRQLALLAAASLGTAVPVLRAAPPGDPGSHPAESPPAAGRAPDYWSAEDRTVRQALPEFLEIPAADAASLTPAAGWPGPGESSQWLRSHGNAAGTRFSALTQIHRGNVAALRPAWIYRSGDGPGNLQCNPVAVDGVLYAPTSGDSLVAIDGASGRERWRFRDWDRVSLGTRPAHRGLVYWPGDDRDPPRLLVTADNHLYALNPADGQPLPAFGAGGKVPVGPVTAAGALWRDVLVIPGFDRDAFAFDVRTGRRLWTFHTIPQPGEAGFDTWDRPASGANCWGGMALDAHRGIAYLSTGSPKPNFVGVTHRGRNLFANCLIALDVRSGERLWHFQEIRHDIWDLDLPAPPVLVTVRRGDRLVDAVAQVTKVGNTLLLDRVTGQPLFPFRLRRAPVSDLPGEQTWPYQPAPELPEPFARQEFTLEDVTDRSPAARDSVLQQIAQADYGWFLPFKNGRPLVLYGIHGGAEWTGACFDPGSGFLYVSSNEVPWIITVSGVDRPPVDESSLPETAGRKVYLEFCVACHGPNREGVGVNPSLHALGGRVRDDAARRLLQTGRNLMPPFAFFEEKQIAPLLDYLFERDRPPAPAKPEVRPERPSYISNGYPKLLDHEGYPGCQPPWGTLNCLDLNTGRIRWKIPLGEHPELTRAGIPKTGTENFGGPTVTAGGLVFCAGTRDEKIRAFDAATGEELWSHPLPFGGYAPPAVYEAGGRQFVVLAATGGGKLGGPVGDAWIAFALPPGAR